MKQARKMYCVLESTSFLVGCLQWALRNTVSAWRGTCRSFQQNITFYTWETGYIREQVQNSENTKLRKLEKLKKKAEKLNISKIPQLRRNSYSKLLNISKIKKMMNLQSSKNSN
jgi:hypothetical protein